MCYMSSFVDQMFFIVDFWRNVMTLSMTRKLVVQQSSATKVLGHFIKPSNFKFVELSTAISAQV